MTAVCQMSILDLPPEILGKVFGLITEIADMQRMERVSRKFQELVLEFSWKSVPSLRIQNHFHHTVEDEALWTVNDLPAVYGTETMLRAMRAIWTKAHCLKSVELKWVELSVLRSLEILAIEVPRSLLTSLTLFVNNEAKYVYEWEEQGHMVKTAINSLSSMHQLEKLDLYISFPVQVFASASSENLFDQPKASVGDLQQDVQAVGSIFESLTCLSVLELGGTFSNHFQVIDLAQGLATHPESLTSLTLRFADSNDKTLLSNFLIGCRDTVFPHLSELELDIDSCGTVGGKHPNPEEILLENFPALRKLSLHGSEECIWENSRFSEIVSRVGGSFVNSYFDSPTEQQLIVQVSLVQLTFGDTDITAEMFRVAFEDISKMLKECVSRKFTRIETRGAMADFFQYGFVLEALVANRDQASVVANLFEDF